MSAEILRRAASLMREHAETEAILRDGDPYYETTVMPDGSLVGEQGQFERHWSPAVALAAAKAMEDVAVAWENCDGWTVDFDEDPIRFEDTVDSGWLAVARTYLGESA